MADPEFVAVTKATFYRVYEMTSKDGDKMDAFCKMLNQTVDHTDECFQEIFGGELGERGLPRHMRRKLATASGYDLKDMDGDGFIYRPPSNWANFYAQLDHHNRRKLLDYHNRKLFQVAEESPHDSLKVLVNAWL